MFHYNFDIGKSYLKKAGTDVIMISMGMKMVMSPGSAYEDIQKEKLPETFFNENLGKNISFSKDFIKQYKITHRVDLDRLLRACSILVTNFNGPEKEDYPKNHHKRLFSHYMITDGALAEMEVMAAIKAFGEILKIKVKKIDIADFRVAAQILGDYYKLWNYQPMYF